MTNDADILFTSTHEENYQRDADYRYYHDALSHLFEEYTTNFKRHLNRGRSPMRKKIHRCYWAELVADRKAKGTIIRMSL